VDLIVGFNTDEFGFLMAGTMNMLDDMPAEGLEAGLKGMAGMMSPGNEKYTEKLYSAMEAVYVRTHMTPHENARAMQQFMADAMFVGPSYSKADKHAATGQKVYMYRLDNGPAFEKNPGAYVDEDKLGHAIPASAIRPHDVGGDHADDIFYTFGFAFLPELVAKGVTFTQAEKQLSTRLMRDWGNFARGKDPWTPYSTAKRNVQILDHISPVREAEHLKPVVVKFWTETLPGLMAEMMAEATPPKAEL